LKYGVPVALATDDAGVSRSSITQEYERAVETYHFSYPELKKMVRASLEYSFLPGESLWRSNAPYALARACSADAPGTQAPSESCGQLLKRSERAREQWRLEAAFAEFESLPWLR